LFPKKRYLILTDRPRLLYLDEGQQVDGSGGGLRCEIGWSSKLLPELKGKSLFSIHTVRYPSLFEPPLNLFSLGSLKNLIPLMWPRAKPKTGSIPWIPC
jgi:hypothetical protein